MPTSERTLLLEPYNGTLSQNISITRSLSVGFAAVCIVDVFGVFPLITTPKAIIQCGFYGVVVVIMTLFLQIYTAMLLGKCWLMAEQLKPNVKTKSRCPYISLAEITWGKWMAYFTTILLDLSIFFAGIPNLIVAAKNLQLLGQRLSNGTFEVSYCYWIILISVTLCPFLWLGSPKDMKFLCMVSASLVVAVFVLIIGCILYDTSPKENMQQQTENQTPLWNHILTTYGIIIFQFDIHPTILTIQVDMLQKNKVNLAIFAGYLFTFSMFGVITICAFIKYGETVRWSLLETLPTSGFLHSAAFLIIIQLGLTSAIGNSALYQHIEECMGVARNFNKRRCVIRSVIMILATVLAEFVPRFDLIMAMIGTTLTGPVAFVLPPLFHIKMLKIKEEHERLLKREVAINFDATLSVRDNYEDSSGLRVVECKNIQIAVSMAIAIFGVISMIVTTYLNVIAVMQYGKFSRPCIYNLTMYLT